jgi:hypothetical protein
MSADELLGWREMHGLYRNQRGFSAPNPMPSRITDVLPDHRLVPPRRRARVKRQYAETGDWCFGAWNAPEVTDPQTGQRIAFEDAPESLRATEPACWVLQSGDCWLGLPEGARLRLAAGCGPLGTVHRDPRAASDPLLFGAALL